MGLLFQRSGRRKSLRSDGSPILPLLRTPTSGSMQCQEPLRTNLRSCGKRVLEGCLPMARQAFSDENCRDWRRCEDFKALSLVYGIRRIRTKLLLPKQPRKARLCSAFVLETKVF